MGLETGIEDGLIRKPYQTKKRTFFEIDGKQRYYFEGKENVPISNKTYVELIYTKGKEIYRNSGDSQKVTNEDDQSHQISEQPSQKVIKLVIWDKNKKNILHTFRS